MYSMTDAELEVVEVLFPCPLEQDHWSQRKVRILHAKVYTQWRG
jgi:hypothetical protein